MEAAVSQSIPQETVIDFLVSKGYRREWLKTYYVTLPPPPKLSHFGTTESRIIYLLRAYQSCLFRHGLGRHRFTRVKSINNLKAPQRTTLGKAVNEFLKHEDKIAPIFWIDYNIGKVLNRAKKRGENLNTVFLTSALGRSKLVDPQQRAIFYRTYPYSLDDFPMKVMDRRCRAYAERVNALMDVAIDAIRNGWTKAHHRQLRSIAWPSYMARYWVGIENHVMVANDLYKERALNGKWIWDDAR